MAQGKSKSVKWLSIHILVYMMPLLFFGIKFALLNAAAHWVIDFFTSRATSYLWKKQDVHNFFVVIGFDQLLHALILIYSYHFLIGSFGI
jgi:hypothetical protein